MVYGNNIYSTIIQDFRAISYSKIFPLQPISFNFKVLYYSFINPVFLSFYTTLMIFYKSVYI
jgi:hypothetical protein